MPSEKRARQRALRELKVESEQRHRKRMRLLRRLIGVVVVVGIVIGNVQAQNHVFIPRDAALANRQRRDGLAELPLARTADPKQFLDGFRKVRNIERRFE